MHVVVFTFRAIRPYASFGSFLLPGGRPRRVMLVIQAGGRPRRLPRPRASRSSVIIASSMRSRSSRSSANIFTISISEVYFGWTHVCRFGFPKTRFYNFLSQDC
jgi:hypothetical protein